MKINIRAIKGLKALIPNQRKIIEENTSIARTRPRVSVFGIANATESDKEPARRNVLGKNTQKSTTEIVTPMIIGKRRNA